jgi:hypothetical protein
MHHQAHGANNRRIHAPLSERSVKKIFYNNAIYPARGQGRGLLLSPIHNLLKIALPAWRPGQWQKMDNPNNGMISSESFK